MCFPIERQELSDCALTYDLARPNLLREFNPDENGTLSPQKRHAIFKPIIKWINSCLADMICG
jgi:hypothetical protein